MWERNISPPSGPGNSGVPKKCWPDIVRDYMCANGLLAKYVDDRVE